MKDPASFVRVTAALFLAFSIFCLLIDSAGLLFFIFFGGIFSRSQDLFASLGPVYAWQMSHMYYYYFLQFLLSLSGIVCSLGVLYKKNWAPPAFGVFLSALILFHLAGIGLALVLIGTLPENISMNGLPFPRTMMVFSSGFGIVINLGMIGLYAWLWSVFRKKELRTLFG
jgi:hypothetical protein